MIATSTGTFNATTGFITLLTIFALAAFVGNEVISKVPSVLHTPLMSGSNAVHGIILVGTMIVLAGAHGPAELILGFLAVLLATLNVVGGFVVTDRMLEMFKSKGEPRARAKASASAADAGPAAATGAAGASASVPGGPAPAPRTPPGPAPETGGPAPRTPPGPGTEPGPGSAASGTGAPA